MNKEDFLNKLRKNTHVQFDMPAVDVKGIQYEDTLKQFIEMTESVGGHVIVAEEGESLDELEVFTDMDVDNEMLEAIQKC